MWTIASGTIQHYILLKRSLTYGTGNRYYAIDASSLSSFTQDTCVGRRLQNGGKKESKRTTSEPRGTRYSSRIVQEKQMEDGNEILFFEKQVRDG